MKIIFKHIGYIKHQLDFNKRMQLPFYRGLNLFTRLGNLYREIF